MVGDKYSFVSIPLSVVKVTYRSDSIIERSAAVSDSSTFRWINSSSMYSTVSLAATDEATMMTDRILIPGYGKNTTRPAMYIETNWYPRNAILKRFRSLVEVLSTALCIPSAAESTDFVMGSVTLEELQPIADPVAAIAVIESICRRLVRPITKPCAATPGRFLRDYLACILVEPCPNDVG